MPLEPPLHALQVFHGITTLLVGLHPCVQKLLNRVDLLISYMLLVEVPAATEYYTALLHRTLVALIGFILFGVVALEMLLEHVLEKFRFLHLSPTSEYASKWLVSVLATLSLRHHQGSHILLPFLLIQVAWLHPRPGKPPNTRVNVDLILRKVLLQPDVYFQT